MNKNSKDKKNNSIVGIIVVAAVFLLSVGGAGIIIPLLIIGVMAYVIYTPSASRQIKRAATRPLRNLRKVRSAPRALTPKSLQRMQSAAFPRCSRRR